MKLQKLRAWRYGIAMSHMGDDEYMALMWMFCKFVKDCEIKKVRANEGYKTIV